MKRNRDALAQMAIYDLLCRMQINLDNLLPSVEFNFCVLDLIGVDTDAYCDGMGECEKCLQKWINESYNGRW